MVLKTISSGCGVRVSLMLFFTKLCLAFRVMMYVTTMVDGIDERGRLIRRQLMRYLSLASLIVFQATSVSVKKRFPTMEHLLDAGKGSRQKNKSHMILE